MRPARTARLGLIGGWVGFRAEGRACALLGQRAWVTCAVALMSALKRATPSGSDCAFSASAAIVSTCAQSPILLESAASGASNDVT